MFENRISKTYSSLRTYSSLTKVALGLLTLLFFAAPKDGFAAGIRVFRPSSGSSYSNFRSSGRGSQRVFRLNGRSSSRSRSKSSSRRRIDSKPVSSSTKSTAKPRTSPSRIEFKDSSDDRRRSSDGLSRFAPRGGSLFGSGFRRRRRTSIFNPNNRRSSPRVERRMGESFEEARNRAKPIVLKRVTRKSIKSRVSSGTSRR